MISNTINNKNIPKGEEKAEIHIPISKIPWKSTPNFRNGLYAMRQNLEHIAGEKVFGKGKSYVTAGIKSVTSYLERSAQMDVFKCVEGGTIITTPPTKEEFITKFQELGTRALDYYSNLPYEQTEVTDHWAKAARP